MKLSYLSCVAVGTVLLVSCGGGSAAVTETVGADTIEASVEDFLAMLPDTSYASAKAVRYTVEVSDTTIPGDLESLVDLYAAVPGALTFRGGAMRQADFGGRVSGVPSKVVVDWKFHTDEDYTPTKYGAWGGGSGWTGQPLYVNWPDSCVARFRQAGVVGDSFTNEEIIVGSLVGDVYFIDFSSGKASRKSVSVGNPIKGTVSLDPTLNGNLYVGQGVPARRPFGALVVDLNRHECSHMFAEDPKALRRWGAYDSSPVRVGKFLFRPGENGTIYKFVVEPGTLELHSAMRYTVNGAAPGIEASMSVYRNYGYTADNHGNVLCINLNNMRPVWHYTLRDDTDATPVVVEEDSHPYVYTGCEIDRQNEGFARFVKLDGLTGEEVWMAKISGKRMDIDKKHFDGGFYASALPGTGNCSGLMFSNCVANTSGQNGEFVAMDRSSGAIVYRVKLKYYAWSSPVGFLNEKNEMYVFTGDCSGNVYLIDGKNGRVLYSAHVGANFESSPVVVDNHLVVGSRGNTIYKMSVL